MIGKVVAVMLTVAAIGMNLSYTQISNTEVIVESVTDASQAEVSTLQFTDVDGNVLMDGSKEYIKEAEWIFGIAGDPLYGRYEYYVMLYFTAAGSEKFKSITESVVARTAEGENVINIMLDGEIISSPIVAEVIYADSCIITGNFTKESAKELADAINEGIK